MKKKMSPHPDQQHIPAKAGFPNPAADAQTVPLDLNELVVRHPVSTYYLRVEGDTLRDAGITHGDIVVVDKSLQPKAGSIVVAAVDGDFALKYFRCSGARAWLAAPNDQAPIALHETPDVQIWGVVTFVVHRTQ